MPTAPIVLYDERVTHQVRVLMRAVHRTPGRTRLYLLAGAILAVIIATAVMQVRLNAWNRPFYDAIERRDLDEFLRQLGVFVVIAGILLVLNVAQTGFNQLIRVTLRDLATRDLIGNWMTRKRAARISRAGDIGVNPDQRIQADAQNLTELTTDLGIGLVQSSVLLGELHRRALDSVAGRGDPDRRPGSGDPRLHGLGGAALCRVRLADLLAGRPPAGAARGRALRARGGVPLRAGAGIGARRRHCAQQPRGRRPARASRRASAPSSRCCGSSPSRGCA